MHCKKQVVEDKFITLTFTKVKNYVSCFLGILLFAQVRVYSQTDLNDYILYSFPPKVEKALSEHLNTYLKKHPNTQFILELNKYNVDQYSVVFHYHENSSSSISIEIAKQSNRYSIIGTHKVPVIFYDDYVFGVFGEKNGRPLKKISISEGYMIKFTSRGNIIQE